jgi:hypothetical protein
MNTRNNLVLFCAGMLFAIATCTPVGANQLIDPEFNGVPALNTFIPVFGPPFLLGEWGAESGAIVGVDDSVTPLTAQTMLAEYYTGSYTQTMQATDVSADPAGSTYTLSAYFNANLPAAQGFVNLSFYDASYNYLGVNVSSAALPLDNLVSTWEQRSITVTAPLTTKYVVSQVAYLDSSLMDSTGAVRAGYVDSASLTTVPEPSTIALLGMGAFGLLAFALRRSRKVD